MDGENHGPVVVARQRHQALNHVERIERVQTCTWLGDERTEEHAIHTACGFVEEDDRRAGDKLACDRDTPFLTTGDRSLAFGLLTASRY